jgi:hypothetical protein
MQKRPSHQDGPDDGDALSPMKRSRLGNGNGGNEVVGAGALTVVPSTSSALVTTSGGNGGAGEVRNSACVCIYHYFSALSFRYGGGSASDLLALCPDHAAIGPLRRGFLHRLRSVRAAPRLRIL